MARKSASNRSRNRRGTSTGQPLRLQRLLASAGFGSRRQCEELIEMGRVEIDGTIVTQLGTSVDPSLQKVKVDGTLLKKQKLVYYAVNKPVGFVTTNRDPQGRPRVIDLVPPSERVFPVGRLDRSSEGLLLLTNDGELAQKLTHPKFGVRKIYRVTVAGKVDVESMKKMRQGIYIAEGFVRVEGAKLLKTRSRATEMEIILREGKNREIRRILARLGHKVQTLRRIAVGPLKLGDLPHGAYRVLTHQEVDKLWHSVEIAEQSADQNTDSKPRGTKKRAGTKIGGRNQSSARKKKGFTKSTAAKSTAAAKGTRATFLPGVTEPNTQGTVIGGDFDSRSKGQGNESSSRRSSGVKKKSRAKTSQRTASSQRKTNKGRPASRSAKRASKPRRKP